MGRPVHGRYFIFFYVAALILIVVVFVGLVYFMATSNITLNSSGFNATTMVMLGAGGIGVLALLTAIFFGVSWLDTRFNRNKSYSRETYEDEPGNYGAPRR